MTDRFGGRVLAGEDSEEDEEEEEEIGFQFGSSRPSAPAPVVTVQPKLNVQVSVAVGEDDETDEEKDDEAVVQSDNGDATPRVDDTSTPERTPRASIDSNARSISRPTTPELPRSSLSDNKTNRRGAFKAEWDADGSVDGVAMMGHSIVERLEPSLDGTIRRIAELTDSQQRLLTLLQEQRRAICGNAEIENIAIVMGKLPQYIRKVQDIRAAMTEISSSVDRMKKRSESLRVDAQSYAIKKENKRESQNQWNKLYAAKSYEGATMSSTISSSAGFPQAQPPTM